jgi:aspartate aminotransferase
MTGWRLGYLAAEKEIIKLLSGLQSHSTSNPTSFAQVGGVASLDPAREADVKKMLDSFTKRRKLILAELSKISSVKAFPPKGTFYVFVNVSKTGMDSVKFANRLLEEAKVAVVPGSAFGAPDHVRMSFACSEGDITKAIGRIGDWLKDKK